MMMHTYSKELYLRYNCRYIVVFYLCQVVQKQFQKSRNLLQNRKIIRALLEFKHFFFDANRYP